VNLGFILAEGRIMRWYRGARGLLDDAAPEPRRRWPRRTNPPAGTEATAAPTHEARGDRHESSTTAPAVAQPSDRPTILRHPTEAR
jgi:hypothetical protein